MIATQVITPAGVARIASGGKWKPAKHLLHVNRYLTYLAGGHLKRVQLNMPPRHGKTEFTAKYFPLFLLGSFPHKNIIYCSATHDLASEKGLAARSVVEEYGPSMFGISVRKSKSAADDWMIVDSKTGKQTGGGMRCAGVGTSIHGRGADIIILDDLIGSVQDAISPAHRNAIHRWYSGSVQTRLTPDGAVINIGTPFHSDDIFGRMAKAEEQGGDKWTRVKLPAIAGAEDALGRAPGEALWPDQWSAEKLGEIRQNMLANGTYQDWQAQYQLTPVSGDGVTEWEESYFADIFYDLPRSGEYIQRVMSIDTSKGASETSDWQAFALPQLDNQGHFWVEANQCRKDDSALFEHAMELIKVWRPAVTVVETNGSGYVLFEKLSKVRMDGQYLNVLGRQHGYKHDNKYQRIKTRLTPQLARGTIHVARTPGGRRLVEELKVYPHGDHDDSPDALEQGMELLEYLMLPKGHPKRDMIANMYTPPKRL